MIKRLIVRSLLLALFAFIPMGFAMGISSSDLQVQKASVYYQQKRPFSFYQHNELYKYYYPHPTLQRSSSSCYWIYTNGTYVYYCS